MRADNDHPNTRLLNRFQGGDQAAEREIATRVMRVTGQLARAVDSAADRAEIRQEVAIETLRVLKRKHPRKPESFDAFIRGIAANHFRKQLGNLYRQRDHETPVADPFAAHETDGAGYEGLGEALRAAIRRLSEPQRIAIVLRYYGGMKDREIADACGWRLCTLSSHFRRGLGRLAKDPVLQDWAEQQRKVER